MTARPARFKVGDLRHHIAIQQPNETVDAAGQPFVEWSDYAADEPAKWIPMGGTESMRGRQLEAGTKGMFIVRFREGYTTQMQVVHDGQAYGITNINPIEGQRRYLELVVTS